MSIRNDAAVSYPTMPFARKNNAKISSVIERRYAFHTPVIQLSRYVIIIVKTNKSSRAAAFVLFNSNLDETIQIW